MAAAFHNLIRLASSKPRRFPASRNRICAFCPQSAANTNLRPSKLAVVVWLIEPRSKASLSRSHFAIAVPTFSRFSLQE